MSRSTSTAAEGELAARGSPRTPTSEAYFHREWVRSLFALAVDDAAAALRGAGEQRALRAVRALRPRDPDEASGRPTPRSPRELGLPVTQVTNHLAAARREFRAAVLETLRELPRSDEEFRDEARELLGRRAR